MAFVCTAANWQNNTRITVDAAVVGIGYDNVEPESFSLLLYFDVMAGGDLEFCFCIIKVNNDDGTETGRYWSGRDVATFATRQQRDLIRGALLGALELLLHSGAPSRVFCCTHDENLPSPALQKHLEVAATFKMCGYDVREEPVCLGKYSWWMERQN